MRIRKAIVFACLLFLMLSNPAQRSPLLAQNPSAKPPAPTIQVYARETVVDVTVTDDKGNPVHGLKQEDFTVKEDNKPQPIKSFEEFSVKSIPPPPKLPPNVHTNLQPPAPSGAVNILLLDGLNTAPPDATDPPEISWSFTIQARVKQEAAKYLKAMPPGTRVSLLGLSRGLRVLQGFTSDPELLSAAVETMDMNMDGRATTLAQWCVQQDMRNRMTLEALSQIAADAASIKGKKNLIWFSAGFPTITDPAVSILVSCSTDFNPTPHSPNTVVNPTLSAGGGLPDLQPTLLKTYGLLAAAQVAIFPINAQAMGDIANPVAPGVLPSVSNSRIIQEEYAFSTGEDNLSLEAVAEATGGTAYYNTNDLAGAVSKAVEKGANYYTLSYVPPGKKYDYSHHTIKIAVNQPGLHLVYRNTYDAIDPATIKPPPGLTLATTMPEAYAGDIRAAMSRSMPTSTQILFTVEVDPTTTPAKPTDPPVLGAIDAKLKDKPLSRYDILYAVPARQLAFADSPDGATHKLSLDFDIAAYDGEGKLVTSLSQTISHTLTTDETQQLAKGPFRFFQQIDLPSGLHFLRIGVRDGTSNKIGTVEIPLTVLKK